MQIAEFYPEYMPAYSQILVIRLRRKPMLCWGVTDATSTRYKP